MSNVTGVISKIYENQGKFGPFYNLVINDIKYTCWKAKDMHGAKEGDTVSFLAKETGEYQGKPQYAVEGAVAVQAAGAAPSTPISAVIPVAPPRPKERNGAQVGACINNAIDAGLTDLKEIETFAQELLRMGDRLALFDVDYKEMQTASDVDETLAAVVG